MWFTSIKVETETKRGDSFELSRFFVLSLSGGLTFCSSLYHSGISLYLQHHRLGFYDPLFSLYSS